MADIITKTLKESGGDYSDFNAWESDRARNLVTADEIEKLVIYNDWTDGYYEVATSCNVDDASWTTDSTRYIWITANTTDRHDYWAWTNTDMDTYSGVAFKVTESYYYGFNVNISYTRLEGLIITGVGGQNQYGGIDIDEDYCSISHNIVFGFGNGSSNRYGIKADFVDYNKIYNNIIYDVDYGYRGGYSDNYFYGNTIVNCYVYGIYISYTSGEDDYLKNNLVTDSELADIIAVNVDPKAIDYCSTGDETADDWGGTGNRVNQTFSFVDKSHDNLQLASDDTGAKGYGADTSSDPNCPYNDDVSYESRSTPYDIGATIYGEVVTEIDGRGISRGIGRGIARGVG